MCFMDDATTPPLKNMLGRFKFNAQHAKLNAIFATLQVPLCPLFCIVIITAWWRLGEWEFQRYLITEWRSEPKNLGSLGTCFGGICRSYRDVFFAHFAFWIGYWSNPRIIQPVKNGMGLSFSCRFPFWSMFMISCCFPFKSHTYTINNPTSKNSSHWAGKTSESVFNDHRFPVGRTEPVNCMKVVGTTWSSLTTVTTFWWKNTHLLRPQNEKKNTLLKKLSDSSFLQSHLHWCEVVLHWCFLGLDVEVLRVLPRLEIFGGPSPKSMGKSTDPCGQKSEGHEEIKATSFVNIHTQSLT